MTELPDLWVEVQHPVWVIILVVIIIIIAFSYFHESELEEKEEIDYHLPMQRGGGSTMRHHSSRPNSMPRQPFQTAPIQFPVMEPFYGLPMTQRIGQGRPGGFQALLGHRQTPQEQFEEMWLNGLPKRDIISGWEPQGRSAAPAPHRAAHLSTRAQTQARPRVKGTHRPRWARLEHTDVRERAPARTERDELEQAMDQHNVHDHGIMHGARTAIGQLEQLCAPIENHDRVADHILEFAQQYQPKRLRQIREVLRQLGQDRTKYSGTRVSIRDVLALVWTRIQQLGEPNPQLHQTLMENLCDQLLDMIRDGDAHLHCSTGRLVRILDTLTTIDPIVKMISTQDQVESFLMKAQHLLEQDLEREGLKERFDAGENLDRWLKQWKPKVYRKLRREFGGIASTRFDREWHQWCEAVL